MKFVSSSGIIRLTNRGVKKTVKSVHSYFTEYNALNKLKDLKGIVNLLDTDKDKGVLYLEYHNLDLHSYIITNNKIIGIKKPKEKYINETVNIFKNMLPTLDECHKRDIIHGDIKPENILLDTNNYPIFIDFGQATDLSKFNNFSRYMGTEGYAPPELEKGILGYFTDVYSLGITLYISLLGKKPHILNDGSIEFDFIENENDLPYKITNMIYDMTDPKYENRPSIEELDYYL